MCVDPLPEAECLQLKAEPFHAGSWHAAPRRGAENGYTSNQQEAVEAQAYDIENHIRGSLRAYGLLMGAISRGSYEARVCELLDHCDPVFAVTIETMLDVRRAIFEGGREFCVGGHFFVCAPCALRDRNVAKRVVFWRKFVCTR
ncbi:hypothetical protein DBIPINDM_006268 [Mesorhizobium sp. AR02]|uniref:hypothetical protein n=1 Tax=Mesorhizobium sp. AR02 TaxID=2865837 RepID=UPI00215FD73F|nr:hypothetical protein [Mesorhizobium sp. AR02]UVK52835.1 hypothetical protein DBIPINDM_006268 [Mesorhizobium sp. AR02]